MPLLLVDCESHGILIAGIECIVDTHLVTFHLVMILHNQLCHVMFLWQNNRNLVSAARSSDRRSLVFDRNSSPANIGVRGSR